MLRRELGIWRRLDHPNIVPFLGIAYGFGMDGTMSLVSVWMSNDTLQNFLARHDDNLSVIYGLQFVRPFLLSSHPLISEDVIAARYCQWTAILWVTIIIAKDSKNNTPQCILSNRPWRPELCASE